ncbi:MAG TPA: YbaB/EbfC family nucleoid-associated protein [Methylococcus sp.]|nr:YbaB/EbfC family nucleoid-associated protein [Methylococcus sp.]
MKNPLANLMQQAQRMQESLQKAQEELAAMEIQGESGGGLVKIRLNGKREVLKIDIDESLLKEDRAILEDLIASAFNDAVRRVAKIKQEKLANITGGLGFPTGFNMPF